ncbi:hypothetical protein QO002_005125 [Pararhizobium capsulatum DSM 1112]|uniref:Uncharacterized protein n=1 Tax=Pararhizobium capsulatum DSM 1112 TaxID=1121113 RepID=A0ABU0BXC6_9HYPH|nr:hypothetical protein [Pararhizobium capsulatum DSM 1112]
MRSIIAALQRKGYAVEGENAAGGGVEPDLEVLYFQKRSSHQPGEHGYRRFLVALIRRIRECVYFQSFPNGQL